MTGEELIQMVGCVPIAVWAHTAIIAAEEWMEDHPDSRLSKELRPELSEPETNELGFFINLKKP